MNIKGQTAYIIYVNLVFVTMGFVSVHFSSKLGACEAMTIVSTPAYCDYPPPKSCNKYIEEMESWIKESMKSDKQWENCTRDLIRCQDEMNQDTLCITPDCQ
ncbi:hypothetical protein LCGC14_2064500 [marine sediment metagenome]|uniref:Uncharacterized protein n=1 Tax=marine sediment metagenome TaxID=412755 RepID=A0A0F9HH88_9ZZZZ